MKFREVALTVVHDDGGDLTTALYDDHVGPLAAPPLEQPGHEALHQGEAGGREDREVDLPRQSCPHHLQEVVVSVPLTVDLHAQGAPSDSVQGEALEHVVHVNQSFLRVNALLQELYHCPDAVAHDVVLTRREHVFQLRDPCPEATE